MTEASGDDRRFILAFEESEFTAEEFGHREHLRAAYIYLSLHPFEIALGKMEIGLRQLLAHLGAPPAKFHVTLTRAWLLAVHHFMHRAPSTKSFDEFVTAGGAALLDTAIMQTHYSPERLFSETSRAQFLQPDLQPIPRHAV